MELTEAVQRILRHGRLILVMVVVFLSIPILLGSDSDASYVASARANFGPDVTTAEESEAMVDTAKAIVTSQAQVEDALSREGIDRDPSNVVDEIDVESVGGSGVLVVSATDADPEVASALANGMAQQLVSARHDLLIGPMEDRLAELDQQLEDVEADIAEITDGNGDEADDPTLDRRLNAALSQQSDIQNQRDTLSQTIEAAPRPALLDPATTPTDPVSSGLAADLVVAGLLGLILGVALAAVIEALRPSIVSGDALAHVLGAPLLGRIPNPANRSTDLADPGDDLVSLQLGLAATSARLDVVHLTGVGPDVDLDRLAGRLQTAVPNVAVELVGSDRPDTPRGPRSNRARHGLVVVAPEVLPRDSLSGLEHLLAITQWPLVGIIAYPGPLWTHYHFRQDLRSLWTRFRAAVGSKAGGRRQAARSTATPGTWVPSGPEVES